MMNLKRDDGNSRVVDRYVIVYLVASIFSVNPMGVILALVSCSSIGGDFGTWNARLPRVRVFFALSLAFIIIVMIVFGILLANGAAAIGTHGSDPSSSASIVVFAIIFALYIIQLALCIKVYIVVTRLYSSPAAETPQVSNNNFGGNDCNNYVSRQPARSTHPVVFVPAGQDPSSYYAEKLQTSPMPARAQYYARYKV